MDLVLNNLKRLICHKTQSTLKFKNSWYDLSSHWINSIWWTLDTFSFDCMIISHFPFLREQIILKEVFLSSNCDVFVIECILIAWMGQWLQLAKINLDKHQLLWKPLRFPLPHKFLGHLLNYKCDYSFVMNKWGVDLLITNEYKPVKYLSIGVFQSYLPYIDSIY